MLKLHLRQRASPPLPKRVRVTGPTRSSNSLSSKPIKSKNPSLVNASARKVPESDLISPPATVTSHKSTALHTSTQWSTKDDETLMSARASGLNWQPISSKYFPSKTANACRKRHERLMERRNNEDWEGGKLELLAKEYMSVRREMWSILTSRLGEKWTMLEAKCMEQGLKTLQQAHRSAQRKNRFDYNQDSGIGVSDAEHDGHSLQHGGSEIQSTLSTTPTVSSQLCPKDQSAPGKSSSSVPDVLGARSLSLIPEYPMDNVSGSSAEDLTHARSWPLPPDSSKPRKATLAIDLSELPSQNEGDLVSSLENISDASPGCASHHERRQGSAPVIVLPELASSSPCIFSDSYNTEYSSTYDETSYMESPFSGSTNTYDCDMIVPPILGFAKQKLIRNIMIELHSLFGWDTAFQTRGSSADTSGSYCAGSLNASTSSERSSNLKRKRNNERDSNSQPQEDDRNNRPSKLPKLGSPSPHDNPSLRFACPYFKRNPGRHRKSRTCAGPGWESVHRVKEHLYRRHALPIHCARCCLTFKSEAELKEHYRSPNTCDVHDDEPPEGFDNEQEKKLRCRKRSTHTQTEEEKWKEMYRTLFPNDDEATFPSPYYDDHDDVGWVRRRSDEFSRYEDYLNRELPRRVRSEVELAVQRASEPLEVLIKRQLAEIVRNCQTKLFQAYHQSLDSEQSSLPTKEQTQDNSNQANCFESPAVLPNNRLHPFFVPPPSLGDNRPVAFGTVTDFSVQYRAQHQNNLTNSDYGSLTSDLNGGLNLPPPDLFDSNSSYGSSNANVASNASFVNYGGIPEELDLRTILDGALSGVTAPFERGVKDSYADHDWNYSNS